MPHVTTGREIFLPEREIFFSNIDSCHFFRNAGIPKDGAYVNDSSGRISLIAAITESNLIVWPFSFAIPMVALILWAFSFASAPWLSIPFGKKSFLPTSDIISSKTGLPFSISRLSCFAIGFINKTSLTKFIANYIWNFL